MKIKTLNRDIVESQIGYRPFTTFFEDFSIADNFGIDAIKDTYNRIFSEWKNDYKYLTEFVMVLNWKIWQYYDDEPSYAALYTKLYDETKVYALENLKDGELQYFYSITD